MSRTETNADQEETAIVEIEVQPFDEDAELQARIWNAFTRRVHGVVDSVQRQYSQTVTPRQVFESRLYQAGKSEANAHN